MKLDPKKEKGAVLDLGETLCVGFIWLGIFTFLSTVMEFFTTSSPFDLFRTLVGLGFIMALGVVGFAALRMIRRQRRDDSLFNRVGLEGKNPWLLALLVFVNCLIIDGISALTPVSDNHGSFIRIAEIILGFGGSHFVNKRLGLDKEWYRSFNKKISFRRK